MTRLGANHLRHLPDGVGPGYAPASRGIGILHIGLGAFHRAHQAAYTDAALAAQGGEWRIVAVSLRSTATIDALDAQDGLFTLIERGAEGDRARIIGAIAETVAAVREIEPVSAHMARPEIRLVSLTVTEKAYGIDRAAMDIDPEHPAIAADLERPDAPQGVIGLLVDGLRRRREAGLEPPAILCCDNLPDNGAVVRAGVLGFARRVDPALADWIDGNVVFPSSMVDRITPAATAETAQLAHRLTGYEDAAAIETEPFSQWVIEDRFPQGRPAWEAGGAIFVDDVQPYERMKLRMLNGAHSLIAYAGFLAGHAYVRDAMADKALATLVDRHMRAAARTVGALEGIDLDAYRQALVARFANPAIAHQTHQIAMDGTEKLPLRILAPAQEALASGDDLGPYAFAVAAWMRYVLGRDERGEPYDLRDPRSEVLTRAIAGTDGSAAEIVNVLMSLPQLFPQDLQNSTTFCGQVEARLATMLSDGIRAAIEQEAT